MKKVEKSINEHGINELKKAVDNYSDIITNNQYFYSYRHDLDVFLSRIVERFLEVNNPHLNFSNDRNKNNYLPKHHSKDPMYQKISLEGIKGPFKKIT